MLVSSFFFNCNALHAWVWLVLPIQLPSFYSSSSSCCVCLPGREPDGSDVAGFSRGTCVCYIWLVLVCVHLKLLTSVPLPVLLTYSWKAVNSLWWSFSTSNPVIWMQMSVKTPTLKNPHPLTPPCAQHTNFFIQIPAALKRDFVINFNYCWRSCNKRSAAESSSQLRISQINS